MKVKQDAKWFIPSSTYRYLAETAREAAMGLLEAQGKDARDGLGGAYRIPHDRDYLQCCYRRRRRLTPRSLLEFALCYGSTANSMRCTE